MFAHERLNLIKKIVRQHQRLNFARLEKLVKVSPATLRRDLSELEKTGEVIRVHGGVLDPGYVRAEIPFEERVIRHRAAKKAIAAAAALLVPPGASVLIDAGSTCLEAGRALLGRKDVRIITHSVALLEAAFRGEASVLCLGGELRKVSGALTGGAALGALDSIHADIALVGASGLDPDGGCSTTELSEAEMKRAILGRSSRKILLADQTKWANPSSIRFAKWNEFNDWITDQAPARTRPLRDAGLKIHVAG
jgi:DeoR/GlpR family transcriptional regulator of sugar metabolism